MYTDCSQREFSREEQVTEGKIIYNHPQNPANLQELVFELNFNNEHWISKNDKLVYFQKCRIIDKSLKK